EGQVRQDLVLAEDPVAVRPGDPRPGAADSAAHPVERAVEIEPVVIATRAAEDLERIEDRIPVGRGRALGGEAGEEPDLEDAIADLDLIGEDAVPSGGREIGIDDVVGAVVDFRLDDLPLEGDLEVATRATALLEVEVHRVDAVP